MKSPALFVSVLAIVVAPFAPAIHAQGRITAPVMGYAFDSSAQGIRSISGFPGASLIDGPVDLGAAPASAAVSPRQDYAIFTADDGAVRLVSLPDLETRNLVAATDNPTRIVFSPSGSAAGLFQEEPRRIQIFTQMPQEPSLAREISLAGISGDVTAAAVSDDGGLVLLLASGDPRAWLSSGGDPVPFAQAAGTAAIAFRGGSGQAVTVTREGQVTLLTDPASGADGRALWPADERTADPAAVRFSADGASVYVASRGGSIAALPIDGGEADFVSCGCHPSGLFPLLAGTLFRLNQISSGPLMLVDVSGAPLRTWFVPAFERSPE